MKKSILLFSIMFSCMLALTQEVCKDIVYPANGDKMIEDCCINTVKYGNIVYYKKDGITTMITARAINWNGQYIELEYVKEQSDDLNQTENNQKKAIEVGDHYQGGIVFYVNHTGQHGLIAAPNDQTKKKVSWGRNGITNALSSNDGQRNSEKILHYHNIRYKYEDHCAARLCDALIIGGHMNWYLPSIDELRIMYENREAIGNFLVGDYCSSTEYGKKDAYSIHFKPCKRIEFYYNKVDPNYFVRCIRKF